jgi:hypothetical protein
MNKLRLAFLVTGIALIFILVYFLFFYSNSHLNPTNGGQNAINIVYSGCNSCSNSSIGIIYSLFNSANSFITGKNISFDTPEGTSLVSNYSITTLPSVIINETNKSEKILDSLVYLNIFNVEENNFVLNTPFLAGVAKGVTYFDLIQNRTVTAFDIFNQSRIYSNANQSVINPSEILYLINGTKYSFKNKTEISFVYSNSSFSAVQSMILYEALKGFGNFTSLNTITSPIVSFSNGENIGGTQFYAINGSEYNSNYFSVESADIKNLGSSSYVNTLEKQLFEFDQNSAYPFFNNLGNFMPFLDIGGRYVEISSMINPRLFEGKNITQINRLITSNKTVGTAFNDSVGFIQTLLCSYIGYTSAPCNSSTIKSDLNGVNSLT